NRTPGVLTESMLNRARRPQPAIAAPILSYENPCRLSRAEYRVCLMLSRGLSKPQIQSELAITNSTMRTHLRNIYAKTGTTGQSDLIYALMSAEPATHLGLAGAVA
ncbi:MAG: helix-turn-helix transcriptional regulator, partial [Pseudomonadota bacterium]|nr:helix-turn-helix transcriptional regulator [Pseudomonadota bacterium]